MKTVLRAMMVGLVATVVVGCGGGTGNQLPRLDVKDSDVPAVDKKDTKKGDSGPLQQEAIQAID